MLAKSFLDTNVLLYLYSDEGDKRAIAEQAYHSGHANVSVPVLNELSRVLLDPKKPFKLSPQKVSATISQLQEFINILPITSKTLLLGLKIGERYRYSYFDSFHLATALENGCDLFFSEDMQSGQLIEGKLRILNPFLDP